MQTDIRVVSIETFRAVAPCRTPLKFGAVVVKELPLGYARATVENRAGRRATGWGCMVLMDLWSWPISKAPHEARYAAMSDLLDAYAKLVAGYGKFGHPIEIFCETEKEIPSLAGLMATRHTPQDAMPLLAAMVSCSPVDHALHDAFGHAAGIDSYRGYGPEHMGFDLSRYLGDSYKGVYPSQFLRQDYVPSLPVFHLVGGLDVLREKDVAADAPRDGVPNSFEEWIARDGVFCLKVKLRGRDLAWDVARTLEVSRIYDEIRAKRRPELPVRPHLTADTNEQCESPEYIAEYLAKVKAQAPQVYDDILYIEQPTERDLTAHRFDMRPLGKLKPVLIDESLAGIEDYRLAMELGWSGIALKSCKCLSADLLFIAMAELGGIAYAVQDLTCPSLSLLESVGLAARIHTLKGVEANSRQFAPAANEAIGRVHPGITEIRDGLAYTGTLRGTGLGMQVEKMNLGLKEK